MNIFLSALIFVGSLSPILSQPSLTEKILVGQWKLIIDIEGELDEAAREEESIIGSIILRSVSGLVENVLEHLDIILEFDATGQVYILVNGLSDEDQETTSYKIIKNKLYIQESDSFNSGTDYWILHSSNILVSYDENGEPNNQVYLKRIE